MSMRNRVCQTFLLFLSLFAPAAFPWPAFAQKAPELGYMYPAAIQAGSAIDVQLGGYDFTSDMQFFVHPPISGQTRGVALSSFGALGDFIVPPPPYWFGEKGRLTAFPIPREIPARLKVASDVEPGLVRWQVANANGSSSTAVFLVSDRKEIVEDRYRDHAQPLATLPIGVSGRLEKIAEVDEYTLTAQRNGPISVELFARRLGANFHGILEVRGQDGRLITDAADTVGLDAALTFAAEKGATYTLRVHDLDFRGNRAFVYRLAITPGPRIVATIPAAGKRGETTPVRFIGYGLKTGKAELETVTKNISFPSERESARHRVSLETKFGVADKLIPLSDHVQLDAARANSLKLLPTPVGVTGRLNSGVAYTFAAKKDQRFRITAQSRAIGGDLDLSVGVLDSSGKMLTSNDDLPGTSDAGLSFKAPADGEYSCRVEDLSGRDHSLANIHLTIAPEAPSFELSIPQQLNLPVGGKGQLAINVNRMGGHTEEIKVELKGLPEGVSTAKELVIPKGKNQLKAALECSPNCAATATLIEVIGHTSDGREQTAVAQADGNLGPRDPKRNQVRHTILTTTLKPAFAVELIDKNRQRAVHRGTTYPAPFVIKRDDGFDGPIRLQMASRQGRHRQGITGPQVVAAKGVQRIAYPCFMPQWLETDRTTRMVVLGVAEQRDPKGNLREITKPADARITMILEGALLRVAQQRAAQHAHELSLQPGGSIDIPLTVSRSPKLLTPVTLSLELPRELVGLISLKEPEYIVPAEQAKAALHLRAKDNPKTVGRWNLVIKASTMQDGKWPVVAQTTVTVDIKPPAAE